MKVENIFEITGDDIARLGDKDLRDLIGLLCQADYRAEKLCVSAIRYGGHQDAKDGGIDVMVEGERESKPPLNGFIPRVTSIFQVKTSDMPMAKIKSEMMRGGKLRPEIKNLIAQKGAYIIVSSGSNVTKLSLDKRTNAMKEVIAEEEGCENLHLDFYDRSHIASWVREHPSMILWVRGKIGRDVHGWESYGNWSNDSDGLEGEYFFDEELRLLDETGPKKKSLSEIEDKGLSARDGLSRLRQKLSEPNTSIRLVGLSGMGKTRLVQALFDKNIGEDSLNPSWAIYTDASRERGLSFASFAEQLQAQITDRAIIIVDNCPPEIHRQMVKVCSKSEKTNLLTIEYDVRDDIPEETQVFRLKEPSAETVKKIILKRYPFIGEDNAEKIANLSGDNPRLAIALASTVESNDTLSGLRDEELFERLFRQRNDRNDALLKAGEACSLFYSFEGTNTEVNSELALLGELVEQSADSLFSHVGELKNRELIQSRGDWRALLPHALANNLAKRALGKISKAKIYQTILYSDNKRLKKSFTRRLSYLHDSEEARILVSEWLAEDGWVGKAIFTLNDLGMEILKNIAPICPEETLSLIENAACHSEKGAQFISEGSRFLVLLGHLAYEKETFYRSASLIAKIVASDNCEFAEDSLTSLFFIRLSRSHATLEDRSRLIEELLSSDDIKMQKAGLLALEGALKTEGFISPCPPDFGARPRNYGYHPQGKEMQSWYERFIELCTNHAMGNKPAASEAKKILANEIRLLWFRIKIFDAIEKSAKAIRKNQSWNEAWVAISYITQYDRDGMSEDVLKRLYALREILKPKDLENRVRAYVLTDLHPHWDPEGDFDHKKDNPSMAFRRLEEKRREIGSALAKDEKVLNKLLPELLSKERASLSALGEGLGLGSVNKKALWKKLHRQFLNVPEEEKNINLLRGFLVGCAKDGREVWDEILDEILEDDVLIYWFPDFQATADIDKRGLERLHKALKKDNLNVRTFGTWAASGGDKNINDDDLACLFEEILKKENGCFPVVKILSLRLGEKKDSSSHSDKLLAVARKAISICASLDDDRGDGVSMDFCLAEIAPICLFEKGHEREIREILEGRYKIITNKDIYNPAPWYLLNVLSEKHPEAFLDIFLCDDKINNLKKDKLLSGDSEPIEDILNKIPYDLLMEWCEKDPENRYSLMAGAIQLFERPNEPENAVRESKNIARRKAISSLLEKAPISQPILDILEESFCPRSWGGLLADILKTRLPLLEELKNHPNEEVKLWAKSQHRDLENQIQRTRDYENKRNRDIHNAFE